MNDIEYYINERSYKGKDSMRDVARAELAALRHAAKRAERMEKALREARNSIHWLATYGARRAESDADREPMRQYRDAALALIDAALADTEKA